MAKQRDGIDVTMKAGGDMSAKQYYFVKMIATDDVVTTCTATTSIIFGVQQNKPAADGRECLVRVLGHSKIMAGATIAADDLLSTTARGSAVTVTAGSDTTTYIAGICTVGASSSSIGEMVVNTIGRAA